MKDIFRQMMRVLAVLTLAVISVPSASAYDFKVGGLCYNINSDGNTVTVTYENASAPRYTSLSGALNLPTSVKNGSKTYTVNAIDERAFEECTGITSLKIPNTIVSVGSYAFRECSSITTVTVGTSARSWGDYVFNYCDALTTVNWNVPDGVDFNFGGGTGLLNYGNPFYHAYNIKNVVFGNNVKRIPSCFCFTFNKLTSVTIPSSITSIGTWAFGSCPSLNNVIIPSSVDSIGYHAFYGCESLSSLTIPTSLKYIDRDAFGNTAWFNNQPDGMVYAGNMAYRYKGTMPANTSIVLKESCIGLAREAFYNKKNLKAITLGKNVKYFVQRDFEGCTGLTTVTWNIPEIDDYSYNNNPFYGLTGISTFNFGSTVKRIPAYLCYQLTGLTNVSIGSSVESIGYAAFSGCTALPAITIPKSVTSIGQYAFNNCTGLNRVNISDLKAWLNIDFAHSYSNPLYYGHNLYLNGSPVTNLNIPSTVSKIKQYAFYGCSGLSQVSIPSSVTVIEAFAFRECTGLTRVDCSDLNTWLNLDFGNDSSNPLYYGKKLYINNELLTSLVLPNTFTTIRRYAFYGCESLMSVVLPSSVTSIGYSAFFNCTGLAKVLIPNSVTTIGDHAFHNCTGLNTMVSKIVRPQDVDYGITSNNVWHFNRVPRSGTLYVPKGSLDDYKTQRWNGQPNPWVFSVSPTFGTVKEFIDGDVNDDEQVNVGDISTIYSIIMGIDTDDARSILSDLNEDGTVNTGDISSLYQLIQEQ